jgi:lipid A 4'-phosphatase
VIKKIKIELIIIGLLVINIFISSNFDLDIYKKFYNFDFSLGDDYLKNFFIKITEIGSSLWFFLICFFCYIFCFLFEKINFIDIFTKKIKKISLFLFTSLLITGLLTQLIKHLVGRPRPNYENEVGYFGINFFTLDSAFHSFPSGHTSTIFIVALVLSLLTPRIKYFYLFFAFLIGFSRVVVGAHYFSDVIGGILIAIIGLKLTFFLFNKFESGKNISDIIKYNPSLIFLNLIIFFIIIILLTIGSDLDIFVSGLFYKGGQIFTLEGFSNITILAREIFLPFLIFYIIVLPIISLWLPIKKIYFNFSFGLKEIVFLWLSMIFNVGIIINLLLKELWGRARPNDVIEFGGTEIFTPWFQISDACISNCSFVSGDASVGFSLISFYFLTKNKNFYWIALFSGSFLGVVRILEGGHFLSDIIIAGFLIFILTYIQFIFYRERFNDGL